MLRLTQVLPFCFALAAACDSGGGAPAADAKAEAKANEDAELEKRLAERKAKREAEAKEKAEAEAEKEAALDALAVVPEGKLPKDLDKACKAVGEAQMSFFDRHYEGETLEKLKSSAGTAIPMTVTACKKGGSIEAAACQKHALETAPSEMKEALSQILRKCLDKFGKEPAGGIAPPE